MRLHKLLHLSRTKRRLLLEAALQVAAIRFGLAVLPFQQLRRLIVKVTGVNSQPRAAQQTAPDDIVWAIRVAARYIPYATCLTQAWAAQVLLERYGYTACLRIGVAKAEAGRLAAHAWLEREGQVMIGGGQLEHYTPLLTLEGSRR